MSFEKNIFKKIKTALIICCAFIFSAAMAQNVTVSAKLDSNVIKIGEQTQLQLSVKYRLDKGKVKILFPQLADTIVGKVQIVSKSKIDTIIPDSSDPYGFIQKQILTITSFDSGYYAIPPFKFVINGDTSNIQQTDAMLLQVQTVPVDTTKAIKDIKAPMNVPFSIKEVIPYILWGLGALAIIILIVLLTKRFLKKKPVVIEKPKPKIPPHIIAFEKLQKIRAEKIWQQGNLKLYYSSISDTIREYIDNRFDVNAQEQTTDEIVYNLRNNVEITSSDKIKLKQLLRLADLVKFAKEQPIENENEQSINQAVEFVQATIFVEKPMDEKPEIETKNNSNETK
ncbi:MAG TPA: hypothetical protein VNG53_07805 [Bacteroidia bacterium]|nr:hypothetical protein [Bacteroidia bacterium]